MKKIVLITGIILISTSAFAEFFGVIQPSLDANTKLAIEGHYSSVGLLKIKSKVESDYGVRCAKTSSSLVNRQIVYKAYCSGNTDLKLKVTSTFQGSGNAIQYQLKAFTVTL